MRWEGGPLYAYALHIRATARVNPELNPDLNPEPNPEADLTEREVESGVRSLQSYFHWRAT
jgi:hypothetical protein